MVQVCVVVLLVNSHSFVVCVFGSPFHLCSCPLWSFVASLSHYIHKCSPLIMGESCGNYVASQLVYIESMYFAGNANCSWFLFHSVYAVCPIRFSRNSLSSDTSVTTLAFTEDESDLFAVITGNRRRLVRSTSELNLSPNGQCTIDSLEILHGPSWIRLSKTGFVLEQQGQRTFLTVSGTWRFVISELCVWMVHNNSSACLVHKYIYTPHSSKPGCVMDFQCT